MGLLRMAARTAVVAGTATAVSGRVARRQANKYDEQQAEQAPPEEAPVEEAPAAAPPAAAASPQDAMISQLENLSQLHNAGVLSDDEFAAAKAKVLGT